MKLCLVNLDFLNKDPPLGLAYLASYLRKYGKIDKIKIIDDPNIINILKKEKPDIVAISSYSYNFSFANNIAKKIKEIFDIPIILGGYHISVLPQHILSSNFDIGVIGEGEQTLLELLKLYERIGELLPEELKKIDGIVFKENNKHKTTHPRALIEPLDKIPFPARDLLKMKEFYLTLRKGSFGSLGKYGQMITSRGCPYNCIFCSPRNFWKKTRFHSAEYVVNEIKELMENYKDLDGIIIWDDLFIADIKRLEKIVNIINEEKINEKIKFSVFGRANLINEKSCSLLKKMNVTSIDFGLESGSESVLKYLKRNTVTVQNNVNALRFCKKYGMRTLGTFIIGSPEETEEDIEKTFELCKDANLDERFIFQLTPLPGTEIWNIAKKDGIVFDDINFDFSQLEVTACTIKPELLLTKRLTIQKFEFWMKKFESEMEKRNRKIEIKFDIKTITRMFSYKFILKIFKNYKEILLYIKNSLLSKN